MYVYIFNMLYITVLASYVTKNISIFNKNVVTFKVFILYHMHMIIIFLYPKTFHLRIVMGMSKPLLLRRFVKPFKKNIIRFSVLIYFQIKSNFVVKFVKYLFRRSKYFFGILNGRVSIPWQRHNFKNR